MSLEITPSVFSVSENGFSTAKRYFRKTTGANPYKITAGSTLNMASNRRINTGQPWLPWEFNNGVITAAFESTNVGGFVDSQAIATPTPLIHSVTV